MISWMTRKPDPITLSNVEAEYVVACEVVKEVFWLKKLLKYLFQKSLHPTLINYDSQSCIKMSRDPMFHPETKHVNNKFHFIRKLVQDGIMKFKYVLADEQITDILKKVLPNNKFKYLRNLIGFGRYHCLY